MDKKNPPKPLVERSGYRAPSPSNAEKTARKANPHAYAGSALAKQEPEKKLTRAQQMEEAKEAGLAAFERMAGLLSGEHVTLPLMQAAYFIIDKVWKKPVDEMRKLVNESLKTHMRENVVEDKSAPLEELVLDYGGETYKAKREVQRHSFGNAPGMDDVRALAGKLGVEYTALCVEEITYKYDEEKTVALIREKMKGKDPAKVIDEARMQKSESLKIEKV